MRRPLGLTLSFLVAALAWSVPALAQTFTSGSTGADGPFAPAASLTLALPPTGVFNFTTITIPAGVIVTFTRNAANTPVTLLATGDVTIAGAIDISGASGGNGSLSTRLAPNGGAGGPGGFDGGTGANGIGSTTGGTGLGPGGGGGADGTNFPGAAGFAAQGGGALGGPAYGTPSLLPLIGGSGGGGGNAVFGTTAAGGGGGGGALLIASSGTINLTGLIRANGGTGGSSVSGAAPGSGGAVRLIATAVTGNGTIDISGGAGFFNTASAGRVRVEALTTTATVTLPGALAASVSTTAPTQVALPSAPTLRIASVAGVAAPATPSGRFTSPDLTLPVATTNPVSVSIAGANIPAGTVVTVRVSGLTGAASSASAALAGTTASSSATVSVTIPTTQPSVISASATFTLTASGGGGPVFVQGEAVERVRVTATVGGPSRVAYVTKSGREIVVPAR